MHPDPRGTPSTCRFSHVFTLNTLVSTLFIVALWPTARAFCGPPSGQVVGWGDTLISKIEPGLLITNIGAGWTHTLAITSDGRVACWGDNFHNYEEAAAPTGLSNVVSVGGGQYHSAALQSDGLVVVWGGNNDGQTNVPSGLTNVIKLSVGAFDCLALKADGTVAAWGYSPQSTPPADLSNVVAIAAGTFHCLALRSDGTVIAWGDNGHPQSVVPAGLSNVTAIACGPLTSLALRNDGSLVAWGDERVPPGVSNLVGIVAGGNSFIGNAAFTAAIRRDGTVIAWDDDSYGQTNVPVGLSNVVMLAAGGTHCVAIIQPQPQISGVWFGAQGATLQFRGFSGQRYSVQAAADLGSNAWSDLPNGTVAGTGFDTDLLDTNSTLLSHRFYRLKASPQ